MFKLLKRFGLSLISDREWDPDLTKLIGLAMVVAGVVGWFQGNDPTFVIGFGSGLIASGKFSKEG